MVNKHPGEENSSPLIIGLLSRSQHLGTEISYGCPVTKNTSILLWNIFSRCFWCKRLYKIYCTIVLKKKRKIYFLRNAIPKMRCREIYTTKWEGMSDERMGTYSQFSKMKMWYLSAHIVWQIDIAINAKTCFCFCFVFLSSTSIENYVVPFSGHFKIQ